MSARTRVATVVTRFEAGAGIVALRGALALDPARFDVEIVAGSGNHLLDRARDAGLPVHLVPSLRSPVAPRDDVRARHELTRLIAAGRFDVVHTHSAKAGTLGRMAAHRAGVPRIVHTFHGFPFHDFQSPARRAAYIAVERRLGRVTDVALCVGTGVAVEAVRRGLVAPERVVTIGVPVPAPTTVADPVTRAAARRTLGLGDHDRVVGCVGRLAFQKAPEHFVAALAALGRDDVVGVWIGDGELADQVAGWVQRAGPRTDVRFVGERADVAELLPAFDVFALPSRYEGLPVAVVEAMAGGVPVVATSVNSVADVVVPGVTGLLVPPGRPDLFGRAVAHLLDHPGTALAMAAAARARLGDTYGERALGDALTRAYHPVPPTRPTSRPVPDRRPLEEHACAPLSSAR